jgi:hypothetical protein
VETIVNLSPLPKAVLTLTTRAALSLFPTYIPTYSVTSWSYLPQLHLLFFFFLPYLYCYLLSKFLAYIALLFSFGPSFFLILQV